MRSTLASFALLAAVCANAKAADLTFKRVWPEWHDSDSFQSLYEDHTGHELTGKWLVRRSHPENRSGLYFLTRVENKGGQVLGGKFVVRVITIESIETRVYTFAADVPGGSHLFELGLTGNDWAGPRAEPVAWEVELDAADGSVITRMASYLWEKPDR
jgi:hypothetical protein